LRGSFGLEAAHCRADQAVYGNSVLTQEAIEYYESISSDKYLIYKKRMHSFLSKPLVESALVGKSSDMAQKRENVERSKLHAIVGTK
jgi:hypothetical protein